MFSNRHSVYRICAVQVNHGSPVVIPDLLSCESHYVSLHAPASAALVH